MQDGRVQLRSLGIGRDLSYQDTITALYERHANELRGLAYTVTHDIQLSQDITQEAFLRLTERIGSMSHIRLQGWLRTVVYNLSIDRIRRMEHKLRKDFVPLDWLDTTSLAPAYEENFYDGPPVSETLNQAISELPANYKKALYCRYCADLSILETAIFMQTTVPAVKSYLFRAHNKIAEAIMGTAAIYQGKITRRTMKGANSHAISTA